MKFYKKLAELLFYQDWGQKDCDLHKFSKSNRKKIQASCSTTLF